MKKKKQIKKSHSITLQKYWLCEFFERCGDNEYYHRYIYSDKNLKDMGYEDEKDDYKILVVNYVLVLGSITLYKI